MLYKKPVAFDINRIWRVDGRMTCRTYGNYRLLGMPRWSDTTKTAHTQGF